MIQSVRYPVISVPEGHLAIINGFLVSLFSKNIRKTQEYEDTSLETKEKIHHLVCLYKPDMLFRMNCMTSNFYITEHGLLFELLEEKIYVTFIKSKNGYYCRRISPSKATHIAISVRVTRKKRPRCSKYLVLQKPLRQQPSAFSALIEQQEKEMASISSEKNRKPLKSYSVQSDAAKLDIKFLSEEELLKCLHKSIDPDLIKQVPEFIEEERTKATVNLQKAILDFCERRSTYKLHEMSRVLLELPTLSKHSNGIESLYIKSEALVRKHLKIAGEKMFPVILDHLNHYGVKKYEKVSDRFIFIDGLLIDVRSKIAIDPQGSDFLSSATMEEKKRLREHNLMSWTFIRSEKKPIKIRSRKLIEILNPDKSQWEAEIRRSGANERYALTQRYLTLNFEKMGLKCVFVEALGLEDCASLENKALSALESPKLKPEANGTLSFSDLIESFKRFCSYEEQESLYLETVWKLMEGKTS